MGFAHGWFRMVFGCLWECFPCFSLGFEDFWKKIAKMQEEEKTGHGPLRRGEGGEVLRRSKGCLAPARPRAKKATPRVHCSVAVLRRWEGTVHRGKNIRILFQKPRIRTSIV